MKKTLEIDKKNRVKKVFDSGIFEEMIGKKHKFGTPPKILKIFFDGDIAFIKNQKGKSEKILEVGCGFGRLLPYLSLLSKRVIGIDFSPEQIKNSAKIIKKRSNIQTMLMRAEKMRFKNNSFDCSLCLNNSLGNMPEIEMQVVREMKRVTKKSGKIIMRVFANNKQVKQAQFNNYKRLGFTGIRNKGRAVITNEGFYSRRFTKKDLVEIFSAADLNPKIVRDGIAGYIAEATK